MTRLKTDSHEDLVYDYHLAPKDECDLDNCIDVPDAVWTAYLAAKQVVSDFETLFDNLFERNYTLKECARLTELLANANTALATKSLRLRADYGPETERFIDSVEASLKPKTD